MDEDSAANNNSDGEIPEGIQLEAVENPAECVMAEIKAEVLEPDTLQLAGMAPQQYIIVAPHETGDGTTLEPASKFIRLEGEDGQSYLLAVTGDTSALAQAHIETGKDGVTIAAVELENTLLANNTSREAISSSRATASTSGIGGKRSSNPPSATDGVNQTWFTTRDDKHAYQKGGHSWKQGQWTKDETEILQSNITHYCEEQNVADPKEIIFDMSKDERKDFYRTIARGLQRPLFSVYRRVTRMYDQKNHRGKYSPEEINRLRELRAKHGSDWAAIGTELGRSASSVKDKCRLMKDNCNSGKWFPDEERRLAQAIYHLTGSKPSDNITQGLSWSAVAEEVGSRSEKQCRTKWLNYLNWKQQGGADWTRQDDVSLVEKIHKMEVLNDQDIDWNELSKDWPSVRSPQWLRGKWWSLKRHIENYQDMDFQVLVDQLLNLLYTHIKNKMRITRLDLPSGAGTGEMALQIPMSLQPAVCGDDVDFTGDGDDLDSFQAFEVLQQWTPSTTTAFFITQPQLTTTGVATTASAATAAAVSVGGTSAAGSDHIIVQAMPLAQSEGGVKVENVQVQLNPQVILRAGDHEGVTGLDQGLTIQLPDGLHSEQDLHLLTGDESIAGGPGTDDEELTTAAHIREHGIIDQESAFEVQVVNEAGISGEVEMEAVVSGGDLVMGCGGVSSPPQFTQSSSNDAEIIDPLSGAPSIDGHLSSPKGSRKQIKERRSSFTLGPLLTWAEEQPDPILISNESDLMGNSSDLESEKVHHHGLGVGDDLH